jgi:hypothetical protein
LVEVVNECEDNQRSGLEIQSVDGIAKEIAVIGHHKVLRCVAVGIDNIEEDFAELGYEEEYQCYAGQDDTVNPYCLQKDIQSHCHHEKEYTYIQHGPELTGGIRGVGKIVRYEGDEDTPEWKKEE